MDICRVKGSVVSTNKVDRLIGMKLLVVKQVNILDMSEIGCPYIAVDTVGAGEGEMVLVVKGSSARQTDHTDLKPVDATIVGIIDEVEIAGTTVFKKYA